jgi:hypothetical protein
MAREITAGEFVAESLEELAARMPASDKEQAAILRDAAKYHREFGGKRKIRVSEAVPDLSDDELEEANERLIHEERERHPNNLAGYDMYVD